MKLTAKQMALLRIIVKDFNKRYGHPSPSFRRERININLLIEAKAFEEVLKEAT